MNSIKQIEVIYKSRLVGRLALIIHTYSKYVQHLHCIRPSSKQWHEWISYNINK